MGATGSETPACPACPPLPHLQSVLSDRSAAAASQQRQRGAAAPVDPAGVRCELCRLSGEVVVAGSVAAAEAARAQDLADISVTGARQGGGRGRRLISPLDH